MKKRVILSVIMVIAMVLSFAGCGSDGQGQSASAAGEETEQVIGVNDGSEGIFRVELTNKTGSAITGFAIKESADAQYPDNMLPSGQTFGADEMRVLYYTPAEAAASDSSADTGEKQLEPLYSANVTFEDGSSLEWRDIPFGDMEEAELCLEDGILYVNYVSTATGENVSTLEAAKQSQSLAGNQQQPPAEGGQAPKKPEGKSAPSGDKPDGGKAPSQGSSDSQSSDSGCIGNDGLVYGDDDQTTDDSSSSDSGCIGDEGLTY